MQKTFIPDFPEDSEFGDKKVVGGVLHVRTVDGWRKMTDRELTRFAFDVKVRRDKYRGLLKRLLYKIAQK